MISREAFASVFPRAHTEAFSGLEKACAEFAISTPARICAFLSQAGHESMGFTRLEENLHFTALQLRQLFGPRFKGAGVAEKYVSLGVEAIANRAYMLKGGNGSESSGDGYRFRGRGWIMLTLRDNYRMSGKALGLPLESKPDLAALPENAGRIAAEFWHRNRCNALSDVNDFEGITARINGFRMEGLSHRLALRSQLRQIMGVA